MNEEWRAVPGFEGLYEVSDFGRVRSLDRRVTQEGRSGRLYEKWIRGRVLRPGRMNRFGHMSVMLGRDGGSHCVHALVAAAFIGPRPMGYDVAHSNGDGSDNRAENLSYKTRRENNLDRARLDRCVVNNEGVQLIRSAPEFNHAAAEHLAAKIGCSVSQVYNIRRKRHQAHV